MAPPSPTPSKNSSHATLLCFNLLNLRASAFRFPTLHCRSRAMAHLGLGSSEIGLKRNYTSKMSNEKKGPLVVVQGRGFILPQLCGQYFLTIIKIPINPVYWKVRGLFFSVATTGTRSMDYFFLGSCPDLSPPQWFISKQSEIFASPTHHPKLPL